MVRGLVSVIVPVYNVEKYLVRCLDSIVGQTYGNIEIILVDDGSSDTSGHICDGFAEKDDRITVLHTDNGGVGSARNFGMEKVTGEYLVFVDSDDYVEPELVETLVANIRVHDADLVICGHTQLKTDGSREDFRVGKGEFFNREDVCLKFLKNREALFLNPVWARIYKMKIMKDANIMSDRNIPLGEDLVFNLDYLAHTERMVTVDKQLYYYCKRPEGAITAKYRENNWDIRRTWFIKYRELFVKNGLMSRYGKRVNGYIFRNIQSALESTFKAGPNSGKELIKVIELIMDDSFAMEALENAELSGLNAKLISFCLQKRLKRTLALYYRIKYFLRQKNAGFYGKLQHRLR